MMKGNKSKLVDSKTCQECGACCKIFEINDNVDFAVRYVWMKNPKITAEDTPFIFENGDRVTNITFNYPCEQLEKKDGKYHCKVWNKERPNFCCTYPDHTFYNIPIWNKERIQKELEDTRKTCIGLRKITVEDVIKMIKKHRGTT